MAITTPYTFTGLPAFGGKAQVEQQAGFTLIEVLIAVVLLSLGILGISALQLLSLKYNDGSYLRSQASIYAYEIMDRMRANRPAAVAGSYNKTLSAYSTLGTLGSNPSIAQIDRYDWYRKLDADLPKAQGAINCQTNATCMITIQWDDARAEGSIVSVFKQVVVAGQL